MNLLFLLKMAWRDSRRNQGKLFLFIASIVVGIAALVAINSFGDNLKKDINDQAKTLLGADLLFRSTLPFDSLTEKVIDSLGGTHTRRTLFSTSTYFPKQDETRFSMIVALDNIHPLYGELNASPKVDFSTFLENKGALVDKVLVNQFDLSLGDSVVIGELTFEITGILNSVPGRADIGSSAAPVIYIPDKYLAATELIQVGSRVFYYVGFRFDDDVDVNEFLEKNEKRLSDHSVRMETADSRRQNINRAFTNLNDFLSLVAFVALLLGSVGVAGAVHVYIKDKIQTVAVLRCLGMSGNAAFSVYLIQVGLFGLFGALLGAALGTGLQVLMPILLGDFLPIEGVSSDMSWSAVLQGVLTGVGVAILFALLPLISVRSISPLRALRASFDESRKKINIAWLIVIAAIGLFVVGFAYLQVGNWIYAILFSIAIAITFGVLVGVAALLMWLVKRFFPRNWGYTWRQSIANLYRPNNQTLILVVSIGLGTMLIATMGFMQDLLLQQISFSAEGERPNLVLFDVQPSQRSDIHSILKNEKVKILQEVPVVTMQLDAINGLQRADVLADSTSEVSDWVFEIEHRVTYRDSFSDSEDIIESVAAEKTPRGMMPVSISSNVAESMVVEAGDILTFNIQGLVQPFYVHHIYDIKIDRFQPVFNMIFPSKALEEAPQIFAMITKTEDEASALSVQRQVIKKYPNVSAIDVAQVFKTVEEILGKITFVIQFMALFSIITGLIVLISSVIMSRYQRIKESVLLRTLGASQRQILIINGLEYLLLGILASSMGVVLALGSSFFLAKFVFNVPFLPSIKIPLLLVGVITFLTIVIGLMNSRGIINKPPLEVLRREV